MRGEKLKKGDKVPFTQIANSILEDASLSLKAKGLYAYLYCKPDDYDFALRRIALENADGKAGVSAAVDELIKAGYLTTKREVTGRMRYIVWTKKPHPENRDEAKNGSVEPHPEKATVGKSHSGKIGTVNNKEFINNKEIENNIAAPSAAGEIVKVFEAFQKSGLNPHINYGNRTQRAAAEFLVGRYGVEKVLGSVAYAASVAGQPYAPVVTTPLELKEKIGKLVAHAKRGGESKSIVI